MKNGIKENMAVYLSFDLYGKLAAGGEEIILEKVPASSPYSFIYGVEPQLAEFEKKLLDLQEGDEFDISLSVEDAYGPYDEELLLDMDKQIFVVDGKFDDAHVRPGNLLQFYDNEGMPLYGKVVSIGLEKVKVDFNNPLAGYSLRYKGKVEKIRPATPEEIEHGLLHDGPMHP